MSTATEHNTDADHGSAHSEEHHGASDKQYIVIALILAALTAIEVSTYYVDFGPLFMPTLFILMIVKFIVVVSYFMHLKFDNKLFSYLFYTGLILALAVYVGALSTFKFFLQKG
ncbi:MAG: cytochrome C oxidase subunit IV family protein [Ilumatobacteraceae bacterium]|jgi:cytochrome c oxidase subunit 4